MIDEKKLAAATKVYNTIRDTLDERSWNYDNNEEELRFHFNVNGDDIPMEIYITVDATRQLIRLYSPLPFSIAEDKRLETSLAVCHANYMIVNGSFDYNISKGNIAFRITSCFRDSLISNEVIAYLIDVSCYTIDEYNDKFLALSKGLIDIEKFLS